MFIIGLEKEIVNQDNVGFAQYDALRIEYEDRLEAQLEKLLTDKYKEICNWKRAFYVVSVILTFFIVGLFG